ncbi:universal stress protein [Candidatus Obscuribacterales bacterium]|nr:universal stress protein [Candidatus Obscuribacterales bacterium]
MNGTSYLLALNGGAASRYAAYFTWALAEQSGARVVAQHVVDTAAVWHFLSYDQAGFIGSGLYLEAREEITDSMYSIAEALMLSYSSQSAGQPLECEAFIDEGEPAAEIARRAEEHDMVVLGYRSGRSNTGEPKMYEKLAETCPCPVLVVGNAARHWSKMQMFINSDFASSADVPGIFQLGVTLGLPIEIYIDAEVSQVDADRFCLGGWSRPLGVRSIERACFEELVASVQEDVLMVVSADILTGQDNTVYRDSLRAFLDQSERRALLLWTDRKIQNITLKLAS